MAFREDLKPERILALEEEVLALWEREKTFEASLERRRDAPTWVFYEGPPTANGKPGIHHVLARAVKDLACRLKTMQGHLVERKGGWDTHGLPVEIEAERTLGIEGKRRIEEIGIAKFNEACRASVFKYLEEWTRVTRRMGYWVDLEHPYVTCSNEYIESLWWILARFHERGLLVRGHKVLPYCPRCSTPLSSHEVGLGFKEVQDPSVFVRFRLEDGSGALLVWTTTPWTLPSNVAVAVNPDIDYLQVETTEGPEAGERLWLAASRVEALKVPHRVVATRPGRDLVGRRYRRIVPWYPADPAPKAFTVLAADFVSTEDGTGLVHIAPAYGEDDHRLGKAEGLPVLHPVDAQGRFKEGAPVAGQFVKEADKGILAFLKGEGLLFRRETVVHSYPHCWRCESPLLYYARDSWYLTTTRFKDRMLELNAGIRWFPESIGRGRFGQWLENNVDWAISRDRYWGTPLPVWVCDRCGAQEAIESIEALRARGGRAPDDLHRPFVDEVTWSCRAAKCEGTMRRTPEVVDCWFDSGAMPFAQWHYPFENRARAEQDFPAAFVSEGVDQTRGWFYTLLAVATMLQDDTAYRSCASLDLVLDAHGKKMSKSKGNVVDPMVMMGKYGADVVRWHLLVRPLGVPLRYDEKDLLEVRNRFFGTLLNAYHFLAVYANADGWTPQSPPPPGDPPAFDRWLRSRAAAVAEEVTRDLETWDTARAGEGITRFVVEDLSNWWVRRNRARFWRSGMDADKAHAYGTLFSALVLACRWAAPVAPFLTDAIHRALTGESVHLVDWPRPVATAREPGLEERMLWVRSVVAAGHAARDSAGLRVRQPLASMRVVALQGGPALRRALAEYGEVVREELNLKSVAVSEEPVSYRLSLDKKNAARRLGALTPVVVEALEGLDAVGTAEVFRSRTVPTSQGPVALEAGELKVVVAAPEGTAAHFDGSLTVLLDTRITPELEAEGIAREVVRRLNELRKKAGLKVEDRIRVRWHATGKAAAALATWSSWTAAEVLAESFEAAATPEGLDPLEVPGHEVRASIAHA